MYKELLDFMQRALKHLNKLEEIKETANPYYLGSPIKIYHGGEIFVGELVNDNGLEWKFIPCVEFTNQAHDPLTVDSTSPDDSGQDDKAGSGGKGDGGTLDVDFRSFPGS